MSLKETRFLFLVFRVLNETWLFNIYGTHLTSYMEGAKWNSNNTILLRIVPDKWISGANSQAVGDCSNGIKQEINV